MSHPAPSNNKSASASASSSSTSTSASSTPASASASASTATKKEEKERLASAPSDRKFRAINVVLQYLNDNGFKKTAKLLAEESQVGSSEPDLRKANILVSALDMYDEYQQSLQASTIDQQQKEIEQQLLAKTTQGTYASKQQHSFDSYHDGNVITLSFDRESKNNYLYSGSADRTVKITDIEKKQQICHLQGVFSAPVLKVAVNPKNPHLMLVSCMNGSIYAVDYTEYKPETPQSCILQIFKDHSKYVIDTTWSEDGKFFVTASYDQSARVYAPVQGFDNKWESVKQYNFPGNVEAVEFIKGSNNFVISSRDDNYLHYYSLETLEEIGKYNVNANGDDHISFAVMDLTSSSDGRLLLASTDRHRMILFQTNSDNQLRNFYGANNDSYSNPKNLFSLSEQHVYSSSQDDHTVAVFDVGTQKILTKLKGHSKTVRDLCHHPNKEVVVSCSYDRSIKLWSS